MDARLIDQKKINIKNVKTSHVDYKFQANQILIKTNEEINTPISLEIELESSCFISSFELESQKTESAIKKARVFITNSTPECESIPIVNQHKEENKTLYQLPLIQSAKIQILLIPDYGIKKGSEFSLTLLNGNHIQLSASSNLDRLWVVENLIDQRQDYGWSSKLHEKAARDSIEIDLNNTYYVSGLALKSINEEKNCFPVKFVISISADNISWTQVVTESDFYATKNTWYKWEYSIQKARYLKIDILEHSSLDKKLMCSKILELDVYVVAENIYHSFQSRYIQMTAASEVLPGAVKLAENNSKKPGVAVQGNDSRLRDATSEYSGIVQLAKDGEDRPNKAVQGNDSRLRNATGEYPGICRLAKNGEEQGGTVVQGNDARLRKATTDYYGIIQLAKNGENRTGVVVQGDDSRLKKATTKYYGICRLAKDGETGGGSAVQGNDSRLRNATGEYPGIIQLASHNEAEYERVLRSDDPRLNEGSEEKKGRVQFARDGEESPLKSVQGSDKRLKPATINDYGIVKLANPGVKSKGTVVQSDDPRLYDARKPLEHSHNYALKDHSLNSHSGPLNLIISEKTDHLDPSFYSNTTQFPLSVINDNGTAAGFSGGIFTYSDRTPGITTGSTNDAGIKAYSKNSTAGKFISENDYAIHLPKNMGSKKSSGKSLKTEGLVSILGGMEIEGATAFVVKWGNFLSEAYSPGDLLTVDASEKVQKIKSSKQSFIGVFVRNPKLVLSREKIKDDGIYIAVAGIIQVKVRGLVNAGDPLGFVDADPGVAQKTTRNQMLLTSLESSDEIGERLIWCVIKNS